MSKQKIKDALLDAAGYPHVGWVAENADHLAQKIAEALNLIETPKPTPIPTPAATPVKATD
jgi:hypothetical protein